MTEADVAALVERINDLSDGNSLYTREVLDVAAEALTALSSRLKAAEDVLWPAVRFIAADINVIPGKTRQEATAEAYAELGAAVARWNSAQPPAIDAAKLKEPSHD